MQLGESFISTYLYCLLLSHRIDTQATIMLFQASTLIGFACTYYTDSLHNIILRYEVQEVILQSHFSFRRVGHGNKYVALCGRSESLEQREKAACRSIRQSSICGRRKGGVERVVMPLPVVRKLFVKAAW